MTFEDDWDESSAKIWFYRQSVRKYLAKSNKVVFGVSFGRETGQQPLSPPNYVFFLIFNFLRSQHCVKSVQIQSHFWSVFSCIGTEYGELLRKSPYSVQIQEKYGPEKTPYNGVWFFKKNVSRVIIY